MYRSLVLVQFMETSVSYYIKLMSKKVIGLIIQKAPEINRNYDLAISIVFPISAPGSTFPQNWIHARFTKNFENVTFLKNFYLKML